MSLMMEKQKQKRRVVTLPEGVLEAMAGPSTRTRENEKKPQAGALEDRLKQFEDEQAREAEKQRGGFLAEILELQDQQKRKEDQRKKAAAAQKKAEEEQKKAEEETKKAEEEQKRAEEAEAQRQTELERKKAEQVLEKAEAAQKKAEEEREKAEEAQNSEDQEKKAQLKGISNGPDRHVALECQGQESESPQDGPVPAGPESDYGSHLNSNGSETVEATPESESGETGTSCGGCNNVATLVPLLEEQLRITKIQTAKLQNIQMILRARNEIGKQNAQIQNQLLQVHFRTELLLENMEYEQEMRKKRKSNRKRLGCSCL